MEPKRETTEESIEAGARITLDIYGLEIALARVLADPAVVKNYLEFCGKLRLSKLIYNQNDRQEPGRYDVGAREMLRLGRHFVVMIDAAPDDCDPAGDLARVRKGVELHLADLLTRLETPPDERVCLDQQKFGPEWEPIRSVRWDEPVAAAI